MAIRWAPFANRRRPLLDEPSGAAKWSPWSSGRALRAGIGFRGFTGSGLLGAVMRSSLRVVVRSSQPPEQLADEAANPHQLPRHGRSPSGGGGSLALRPQCLLQPVPPRVASPAASAPPEPSGSSSRTLSALLSATLRSALTFVQGRRVNRHPPKGRLRG